MNEFFFLIESAEYAPPNKDKAPYASFKMRNKANESKDCHKESCCMKERPNISQFYFNCFIIMCLWGI